VATEQEIRGPALENAKRLVPLRDAPCDSEMAEQAMSVARSLANPTFGDVLSALPNRSLGLATLWRLIARGTLRVEVSTPITFDTAVTLI
jgi:hypothetical protein